MLSSIRVNAVSSAPILATQSAGLHDALTARALAKCYMQSIFSCDARILFRAGTLKPNPFNLGFSMLRCVLDQGIWK